MNRTAGMVGVLVVLLGIAGYVWSTSGGTEVDKSFETMKQPYVCPHCNGSFELTGAETTAMIGSNGGIICTLCSKNIDDFIAAKANTGSFGDSGDEQFGDDEPDENQPPKPSGGRTKRN